MDVLDIGCNTGFFDMILADCVKTVTDIEYSKELAELAQETARIPEISNAVFYSADFNKWHKENTHKHYAESFMIQKTQGDAGQFSESNENKTPPV